MRMLPALFAAAGVLCAQNKPAAPILQMARYKGTGSIDEFESFTCVKP